MLLQESNCWHVEEGMALAIEHKQGDHDNGVSDHFMQWDKNFLDEPQ